MRLVSFAALIGVCLPCVAGAQVEAAGYTADECPPCAGWNASQPPVPLFGNTFWVGTRGLGAVLVTSSAGHVLVDGGLPESVGDEESGLLVEPGDEAGLAAALADDVSKIGNQCAACTL